MHLPRERLPDTRANRPVRRKLILFGLLGLASAALAVAATMFTSTHRLVVLTSARLSLDDWQRAIDRQDYLVRLELDASQPDAASGRWHARMDGEPVAFEMREGSPHALSLTDPHVWRLTLSAPSGVASKTGAAGAIALVAYAAAADGGLYDEDRKRARPLGDLPTYVDIYAALAIGKREECAARYPTAVRLTKNGGAVVTRPHRD